AVTRAPTPNPSGVAVGSGEPVGAVGAAGGVVTVHAFRTGTGARRRSLGGAPCAGMIRIRFYGRSSSTPSQPGLPDSRARAAPYPGRGRPRAPCPRRGLAAERALRTADGRAQTSTSLP